MENPLARTSGSDISSSLEIKRRIIALRDQGWRQADIADAVGKDRSYVSRVIKQASDGSLAHHEAKAAALAAAVEIKKADSYAGSHTIAYELHRQGFDENQIPANGTLFKAVRDQAGTWKAVGGRGDSRSYHNYFIDGLDAPCQRIQLDGWGPFNFAGESVYLFVAQDRFSRLLYAEIVPHTYAASLQPFIRNMVGAIGVPEELQLDNAVTWRCQHNKPGRLVWSAIQAGIGRIHFIPESQPTRNGGVERVNYSLDVEWLRKHRTSDGYDFSSLKEARDSLAEFLIHYNESRQHRALPKISKRFHCTPSQCHKKRSERASLGDQTITFTRYMVNPGFCTLHSSVVAVCPQFAGAYLSWECSVAGSSGRILRKGEIVGEFDHNFTGGLDSSPLVIEAKSVSGINDERVHAFDALAHAKKILDHQRVKKPRLQLLPQQYRFESYDLNGSEQWRIIDVILDDVVFDSLNIDADHIKEFLSFAS